MGVEFENPKGEANLKRKGGGPSESGFIRKGKAKIEAEAATKKAAKKEAKALAKKKAKDDYLAQLVADTDDLGFYSKAEKAVRSIQKNDMRPELVFSMTQKGKAIGILPEAGVSTEQIRKLGIDKLIEQKTKSGENITKQELLDFVNKNKTKFSSEEYMSSGDTELQMDDTSMAGQQNANVTMADDEGRVATFAEEALNYLGHDNSDSDISWEDIISRVHKYDPANFPANNTTKAHEIEAKMKALKKKEGASDTFTGTLAEDWQEYQRLEAEKNTLLKDDSDTELVAELQEKQDSLRARHAEIRREMADYAGDRTNRQVIESGDASFIALNKERNQIDSQRQALDFEIDLAKKTPKDWSGDLKRELLENGGVSAYEEIDNPALVNALSQAAEGAAQDKYEANAIYDWVIDTPAGEYSVHMDPEEMSYDISGTNSERVGEYNHQEDVMSAIRRDLQETHGHSGTGNTEWSDWTANHGKDVDLTTYREIAISANPLAGEDTVTRDQIGGHSMGGVSDENTVAHLRVSDKLDNSDDKVLYIHEEQSDWAQAAREVGVTNEENDAKLLRAKEGLRDLAESRDLWQKKLGEGHAPKARADIQDKLSEIDEKISNKRTSIAKIQEGPVPRPPTSDTESMEVAMQTAFKIAADEGYSKVAWSTPEEQGDIYGKAYMEMYNNHYGKNMPKYAEKYAKKYGSSTGKIQLHSKKTKAETEYQYIEITDKLKKHLQKGMGYAKGGLVTNNQQERQAAHQDYLNSLTK